MVPIPIPVSISGTMLDVREKGVEAEVLWWMAEGGGKQGSEAMHTRGDR